MTYVRIAVWPLCSLIYSMLQPFLIMQDQQKVYGRYFVAAIASVLGLTPSLGFTVSLYEYEATIPTLWEAVRGRDDSSTPGPTVCSHSCAHAAINTAERDAESAFSVACRRDLFIPKVK